MVVQFCQRGGIHPATPEVVPCLLKQSLRICKVRLCRIIVEVDGGRRMLVLLGQLTPRVHCEVHRAITRPADGGFVGGTCCVHIVAPQAVSLGGIDITIDYV